MWRRWSANCWAEPFPQRASPGVPLKANPASLLKFSWKGFVMRGSVVHLLLVALLVAGCSGADPQASPETTSSPPVTTSAEPSPSASEPAKRETAREFVQRWVELSNHMQITGETDEYLLVSSDCTACVAVASDVESYFGAGGWVKTDGWSLVEFERTSLADGFTTVRARVAIADAVLKRSRSAKPRRLPGGVYEHKFVVERTSSGWVLADLIRVLA